VYCLSPLVKGYYLFKLLIKMKNIRALLLIVAITIFVGACNTPTTPTVDVKNIQNTVMTATFTMSAETNAALSTLTIAPSTETPTSTPIATETSAPEAIVTPTPVVSAGGNSYSCNLPLKSISGGSPTKIKIQNDSRSRITVRLTLNKTPFGDCGYRDYAIGRVGSFLITDLVQGCYNITVLINDPNHQTTLTGYGCINNPDKWTFIVKKDLVSFQG
jgi:hypothetical protein